MITEKMKRQFACPTCGARKGYACTTKPRDGGGFPVPPMAMKKAHDARARLARWQGRTAPLKLMWCDGTTLRQYRDGIARATGTCAHGPSGGAIVTWTEEHAKWKASHDRAVRLGGME